MSSVALAPILPFALLSESVHQVAHNNSLGGLNYLWLTPLNIATNLTAMVITPIISVVNLVAAGFFAGIGVCCSNKVTQQRWYNAASDNVRSAVLCSTMLELVMFTRLFNVYAFHGIFD